MCAWLKIASREKLLKTGEAVFVQSAQTVAAYREKACWYGETVSEQTIYSYVKGNPLDQVDPLGLDPCAINLDQLIDNAISGATDASTGKLRTKSNHNCATTVRNDLVGAGGPRLPPLGRNSDGVANTPTNSAWGSTLVNGCYKLVTDPASYIPQKGDIAITEGIGTGHISIYDGSTWDADFASPNAAPGSTGAYKGSVATIYQYVGNK